ncbi:DUF3841 domain-containing protein [Bacillus thuringiensis]|uniref:DUF3841 domain-containing protein n=1 Tax=Bacillus thuringiensis TaxID=1428 RepID=UPI0021D651F8|nr:DUF3841 domain-containing protein [Bacillus thuringiensis]MCU7676269.1 DUF3841 domain-containing protein [Bacillus thuringiensis]
MIVYTVQHEEVWKKWKKQGFIIGDEKYVDSHYKLAYRWMKNRMKSKIPSYQGEQPIWIWYKDNYPDRNVDSWGKTGEKFVILTLEVPENAVLWSDYQVWHGVLNDSIPYQKRIDEGIGESFEVWEKEMEKEYDIMFDFGALRIHPDWYLNMPDEIEKQGVVGKLPISAIKRVQRFCVNSQPKKYSKRVEARTNRINRKRRKLKEKKIQLRKRLYGS